MKLPAKIALFTLAILVQLSVAAPVLANSCTDNGGTVVSGALGGGSKCIGSKDTNPIYDLVHIIVQFAVGLFGLILVLMITYAGFQYIISQGDPNNTKAARQRIEQAVTGLILFVLMYAILNALIPGGVF